MKRNTTATKRSTETARTGLYSLTSPGRPIDFIDSTSSGYSKVMSLSELASFLYLEAAWFDISKVLRGTDLSDEVEARESVLRLLTHWLRICSLDMTRLH